MVNNIDPDQTVFGSSLVRVYSVYFHDKISPEVHLNICSRLISRHHFQDKLTGMFRVISFILLQKQLTPVTSKLIG